MRLPWEIPDLHSTVDRLLRQIPRGRVSTAGALAEALGNRLAAVWVGHYLLHHRHTDMCPCHRAIRAGGVVGPYIAGGETAKADRLRGEGIPIIAGRIDLGHCHFDSFVTDRPLQRLAELQNALASEVELDGPMKAPRTVAGVDVAYPDAETAQAAYALVEVQTGSLAWTTTIRCPARFPYIRSYLTFRELPALLGVIEAARSAGKLADVVMVDGTGVLHPRRAGIASHLGVVGKLPTVGVTKKSLCGECDLQGLSLDTPRPVLLGGVTTGAAILPTTGTRRPLYVSPGHLMSVEAAVDVVRKMLRGRRLPEPIYWADRLSKGGR
ncbi:MAG: endonuclease V [Planctomycetota bacterium]